MKTSHSIRPKTFLLASMAFAGLSLSVPAFAQYSPQTAVNLGVISDFDSVAYEARFTQRVTLTEADQVAWYRFTIPAGASATTGRYLDIATVPSNIPTEFSSDDTEIGLYNLDGTLVASNDDSSVANYSQLSFSQALPALPARGPLDLTPDFPIGTAATGQNGPLAAGTYLMAVTGFNASFGNTLFNVTTTNVTLGSFNLEFRTDIPPIAFNPSSAIDLGSISNTTADLATPDKSVLVTISQPS